jgi:glyoxalase family protein
VKLLGIHHITAIATEPQRNLDFYTGTLGLRFVKRTVNFDDPGTYHFYFGDRTGTAGTVITFFPWPGARRGTRGNGQVVAASFAIPREAIGYWKSRFKDHEVFSEEMSPRFGETVLRLVDPDGLLLELIESERLDEIDLDFQSEIPGEFALRGFHAPSLEVRETDPTERLLTETMGFELMDREKQRRRLSLNEKRTSAQVDLIERPEGEFGHVAAGTVHHIAFCAETDLEQLRWREKLVDLGLMVTPVIDRQYFHSIYFREPGGILFEIATRRPGFAVDEPVDHLGETLKLPPQYEAIRGELEASLPAIQLRGRRNA